MYLLHLQAILPWFSHFSHDFPMIFSCFSHDFPFQATSGPQDDHLPALRSERPTLRIEPGTVAFFSLQDGFIW